MSVHHEEMPPFVCDSVGMDTSPLSYSSKGQDEYRIPRMLSIASFGALCLGLKAILLVLVISPGESSKDQHI